MPFENYSPLLSSNLFLQTPVMDPPKDSESPLNPYDLITQNLEKLLTDDSINSKDLYVLYMQVSNLARDLIIEFDKIRDDEDLQTVFQLWNVRLTTLVCANELNLAQKESKRLSTALEAIHKTLTAASDQDTNLSNYKLQDNFPREMPLSLKLLIIRLRTQGPNTALNSEYFKILTDVRQQYTILDNEKSKGSDESIQKNLYPLDDTFKLAEILAYAVAGNLIAKREYKTLLTHTNSILAPLVQSKGHLNQSEIVFKDQISIISMLVAFITGDLTLGTDYIKEVQNDGNLKHLLEPLTYILNTVDPVLDHKKESTKERKKYVFEDPEILDQIMELVEEQAITGRILCSLCALFELRARDDQGSSCDFFEKGSKLKNPNISNQVFKLSFKNTNKLYGFE